MKNLYFEFRDHFSLAVELNDVSIVNTCSFISECSEGIRQARKLLSDYASTAVSKGIASSACDFKNRPVEECANLK